MGKLELKGLTKSFGLMKVVHETDLIVEDGEFVVFVGPSGCGKSTMLRMFAGLEEISGGELLINDRVVNDVAPVERGIAMVFQSYALYPHMTVYENIAFPLQVAKMTPAEIDRRVTEAAKVLKLEERLQHKPAALSGGQRQRVAIGRAIVREPSVFLFDEPLSNLDAALRAEMRVELTRLHAKLGATMVYVTHDQIEAMTMADKIVVLRDGVVEQVGSPLDLFHHPHNRFVASFLGNPTMNFLPARATGCDATGVSVRIDGVGQATLPVEGEARLDEAMELGIRPDDLQLGAGSVRFHMTPEVIERLGNQSVVHGVLDTGQAVCAVVAGGFGLRVGVATEFGFDPAAAHLFRQGETALRRRAHRDATQAA
ncbi:sn-glycerol-3-phosphate ABC transporter ATP-binding protein UgpC [Rhodobacteraceae bacterium]|nr:sn-glycerol-3-phosphate ABC transporter ATP-binding protein UgpC [Paracoccaceae bacterium]